MSEAADQARARAIVSERADGACEMGVPGVCLGRADTIHHRRKRRFKDTLWSVSNLVACCGDGVRGCHGWVEAHPNLSNVQGLWLFGHQSPQMEAIHMRSGMQRSWWVLDDDGTATWVPWSDFEDIIYSTAAAEGGPAFHVSP